jgi:hypothetical protein
VPARTNAESSAGKLPARGEEGDIGRKGAPHADERVHGNPHIMSREGSNDLRDLQVFSVTVADHEQALHCG